MNKKEIYTVDVQLVDIDGRKMGSPPYTITKFETDTSYRTNIKTKDGWISICSPKTTSDIGAKKQNILKRWINKMFEQFITKTINYENNRRNSTNFNKRA